MLVKRLLLLSTFAGGCLSGAVLIGFWHGEAETILSPTKQRIARTSDAISPPIATTTAVRERAIPNDAPDARTEAGSSVADVLARLEAAYRKELPAAAPADAPSSAGRNLATTARTEAPPIEVRAPVPAQAETAVALAPAAPPPANAPRADAHPATATQPGPVLASREDAEPRNVNVHIGDTNQNTHVGDVFQGDVYVVQQLAVPGYLPYFAAAPYARAGSPAYPAYPAYPGYMTRGMTSRDAPTFASSWTVPSDRLGYDSALVPRLK